MSYQESEAVLMIVEVMERDLDAVDAKILEMPSVPAEVLTNQRRIRRGLRLVRRTVERYQDGEISFSEASDFITRNTPTQRRLDFDSNQPPTAPSIPAQPLPPHNGTDTSKAAAESKRSTAAIDRERVLAFIESSTKGATCDEICAGLSMKVQTATPRIWELKRDLKIIDSGQRRETRSGRTARVYIIKHDTNGVKTK